MLLSGSENHAVDGMAWNMSLFKFAERRSSSSHPRRNTTSEGPSDLPKGSLQVTRARICGRQPNLPKYLNRATMPPYIAWIDLRYGYLTRFRPRDTAIRLAGLFAERTSVSKPGPPVF
ncbi:MAG: hypothetical protein L6R36_000393 [Xanthoria steineri]|nr:MAG: hypothetical protein L6R36_000393 [Xanthoria steineri]